MNCPKCNKNINEEFSFCPNCGIKLSEKTAIKKKRPNLPKGFGQISKINDCVNNPYRVLVNMGKKTNGESRLVLLKPKSYFRTYKDAYEALLEYNNNPYSINDMVMSKLYNEWTEYYFKKLKNDSSKRIIISCWKYCSQVYDLNIKELKSKHIKMCMEEGFILENGKEKYPSSGTKERIKSMFNLMLDYAVEYEYVNINVSRQFNISEEILDDIEINKKEHITYSEDEISFLEEYAPKDLISSMIYIQCYMGWRPTELLEIRTKNVNINKFTITGGMKTKSGINRTVPIPEKIRELVKNIYEKSIKEDSQYLFNINSKNISYDKFRHMYVKYINDNNFNPNHRLHDGRIYFVTKAKECGVDEYAIKKIVGHIISDITESIYTKRDPNWIENEMSKIK